MIIRAFNKAKSHFKSSSKAGDDYVEKEEFVFLLKYLRQYFEYWIMFDRIDTSGDRRITLEEFKKG